MEADMIKQTEFIIIRHNSSYFRWNGANHGSKFLELAESVMRIFHRRNLFVMRKHMDSQAAPSPVQNVHYQSWPSISIHSNLFIQKLPNGFIARREWTFSLKKWVAMCETIQGWINPFSLGAQLRYTNLHWKTTPNYIRLSRVQPICA